MTRIIGLSGRAGSGKDTVAKVIEKIYVNELFKLGFLHHDEVNKPPSEIFVEIEGFKCPLVKIYSFAYWLKFICVKVLGLTWEQCYTEEGKNTLTHLKWTNAPNFSGTYDNVFMTAREVMQWWGSEVFRFAYNNVWVNSTIGQIKEERPMLAIVSDCRFINEVEGIQKEKGLIIRLTRNEDNDSQHISERQLDDYNGFDYIFHNKTLNLEQQEKHTRVVLKDLNII